MEKTAEKNGNGSRQFHDGGRFKTKLSKFESEQLVSIKAVEFVLVDHSPLALCYLFYLWNGAG
jgi:hypothetical protein